MPNPFFKFKRFTVYHDRCAMKVGTDGVLLGAWADVQNARCILDVGTGTGLIALMLAQRSEASIHAVDVDTDAVEQARENVKNSPWADRIDVCLQDIKSFPAVCSKRFDLIVSNPPYFTEAVKCPESRRNAARHTDGLSFSDLLNSVSALLADEGAFSVILPAEAATEFIAQAIRVGLYLTRQVWIHTKPQAVPKRVLMTFKKCSNSVVQAEHLTVEIERHVYSPEFSALVKDYYLFL